MPFRRADRRAAGDVGGGGRAGAADAGAGVGRHVHLPHPQVAAAERGELREIHADGQFGGEVRPVGEPACRQHSLDGQGFGHPVREAGGMQNHRHRSPTRRDVQRREADVLRRGVQGQREHPGLYGFREGREFGDGDGEMFRQ